MDHTLRKRHRFIWIGLSGLLVILVIIAIIKRP